MTAQTQIDDRPPQDQQAFATVFPCKVHIAMQLSAFSFSLENN
jgi:hypothetical protein